MERNTPAFIIENTVTMQCILKAFQPTVNNSFKVYMPK